MNVPSLQFLGFVVLAAVAINCSGAAAWRRGVLLAANVAFFLSFGHDPRKLAPFLFLLVLGFVVIKAMERRTNGIAFFAALVALLTTFFWLKQYAFVPHRALLPFAYATVGMSYVFFRILGLVIDSYQGSLGERVGPLAFANYTLNFTCLVSGPIQSYAAYRKQEAVPAPFDASIAWRSLERVIVGFFKVMVVSPVFSYLQDVTIATTSSALGFPERALHAALLIGLFPLYLYTNFSGYCDVVIGAARFLRIELPENFNRPFSSQGFIEFWNRWHMTLSHWLKTYVYSPLLLALMRRFPSREIEPWLGVAAYFATFFVIGLWHGQTSTFAFFGVLLGLGVSVNKGYQIIMMRWMGRREYVALTKRPLYASVSRAVTFFWFAFSLLWFWSTWGSIAGFAGELGAGAVTLGCAALMFVSACVLSAVEAVRTRLAGVRFFEDPLLASPYLRTALATSLFVIVASVEVLLRAPAPHVVYRGF